MKVLLKCLPDNWPANTIEAALVVLSPELAQSFLDIRKAADPVMALRGFWCIELFDQSPKPVAWPEDADEQLIRLVEEQDAALAPDAFELPESEFQSDSSGTVLIREDGISWNIIEKHTNIRIETCPILWTLVEQIANSIPVTA